MKLWEDSPREVIQFDDLVFSKYVDDALLRALCNPAVEQNLLLHGPAGTGKSVACRAIAAARTKSTTLSELTQRVRIVNAKSLKERNTISADALENAAAFSRFADDVQSTWIIDEIDFVTETQQNQVIAAIDKIKDIDLPLTILATTNRELDDKRFDQALISRFHFKEYVPEIEATAFVELVKKYLSNAGVEVDDALVEEELEIYADEQFGATHISFREVRSFVNRAIMTGSLQ